MTRLFAIAAALGLLIVFSLGCRQAHLGPNAGDSYRAAFAKQIEAAEAEDDDAPELSAEDAKQTLRVHQTGEDKAGPGAVAPAPGMGGMGTPAPSTTSSGGKWPGASGNIQLEAK